MGVDRGFLGRRRVLTDRATEIETERNKETCLAEWTESMGVDRNPKVSLHYHPTGRRGMGRPCKTWTRSRKR
jgi:hypothetical protein